MVKTMAIFQPDFLLNLPLTIYDEEKERLMEMEGKHSETTFLVVEVSSNGMKPLISLWNGIKYFF